MTTSDHSEGIRPQAERVVRAYKELREATKGSDFTADDYPVGLFAELVTEIKRLDGWLEPVADDGKAETGAERIERELDNVRSIIDEIEHLAHDGRESSDPAASLAIVRRLAREAHATLYGRTWDRLTDILEQQPYQPLYGELWSVIEDFSADELAALRNHAAAIRARRS